MTKVSFLTVKGSSVELAIITETPNLADRNVTNECYRLTLSVNGNPMHGGVERIDHPEHGACLKPYFGGAIIPIPVDKVAAIDALIAQYTTQVAARSAVIAQIDDAYEADYAAISKMMEA